MALVHSRKQIPNHASNLLIFKQCNYIQTKQAVSTNNSEISHLLLANQKISVQFEQTSHQRGILQPKKEYWRGTHGTGETLSGPMTWHEDSELFLQLQEESGNVRDPRTPATMPLDPA